MSAEKGWIADPPPPVQWRDSRYSREADRIAAAQEKQRRLDEQAQRYAHLKNRRMPDHIADMRRRKK